MSNVTLFLKEHRIESAGGNLFYFNIYHPWNNSSRFYDFFKKNMESSHGSGLLDTNAKSQRQAVFRLNYCFCCAWSQWVILRFFGLRGLLAVPSEYASFHVSSVRGRHCCTCRQSASCTSLTRFESTTSRQRATEGACSAPCPFSPSHDVRHP